jgi:Secretory lipase
MHATFGATRRSRRVAAGATLALVTLLAAACTSDGQAEPQADDSAGTTDATLGVEIDVEEFTGTVDEFYRVPDPLPEGAPGDVLRTMAIDAPDGTTGLRIMYLSDDAQGEPRAATGMVHHPDAEAPDGGWPVVAWAHGTSGLASQCAPSRTPSPPPDYGIEGVYVSADYIGLGPEGEVHPYLSSAAEGHAVIDAVAAAHSLPQVGAGDEWVVAGVSQGGHAALVTNEMAAERLPDLPLLGAAALAPGAELALGYGDVLQIRVITTMALVGVAAEDPEIVLENYLSPAVLEASSVIETGCVGDIIDRMAPIAGAPDYFLVEPSTDPVGLAWLEENNPGLVAGEAPLLLVQGGADALVVPARTDALFARLCSVGQVVERLDVPTATHDSVVDESLTEVGAWLQARFAGEPATDDC